MQGRPSLRLRRSYSARCRVVRLMLSGLSPQAASRACGMSRSTAYRLLGRYRAQGWDGLRDRPPIARHHPRRLSVEAEMQIVELRRRTGWGPRSLSAALGRPASTIWRVLKRYDCSRAARQPRPPANRYDAAVGELIHLDIKRLGRFWHVGKRVLADGVHRSEGAGWSYAHVAVDEPLTTRPRPAARIRRRQRLPRVHGHGHHRLRRARHTHQTDPDRQRQLLPQPRLRRAPARPRHPPHPVPAPTRPAPTAKPKHSSASCNANRPTASSTPPASTEPKPSSAGYAGTTTTDHTAASTATPTQPRPKRSEVLHLGGRAGSPAEGSPTMVRGWTTRATASRVRTTACR